MQKLLLIVLPLLLIVGCEKNGLHIEYYKNGKKKSEGIYKNGKKDGLWSYWNDNEQKSSEETYKDGKEIETIEWTYYENGKKKSTSNSKSSNNFRRETKTVDEVFLKFKEDDSIKKKGLKKSERRSENGKEIETIEWTYYENGKKKSEGTYKDGKKDGLWTYWYKNGKKTAKRIRGGEYGNFYFPPTSNMYEVEYMAGEYELEDNPRIDPEAKCWDEDGNECICADYWYGCGKDSPYSKYIGNRNGHWEGYILGKYCNGSAKLTIRENGYVRLVMLTELCSYGKTVHTGYINPYNMKFVITSGDSKREGAIVDIKKGFKIVLIYTGINIDVYF